MKLSYLYCAIVYVFKILLQSWFYLFHLCLFCFLLFYREGRVFVVLWDYLYSSFKPLIISCTSYHSLSMTLALRASIKLWRHSLKLIFERTIYQSLWRLLYHSLLRSQSNSLWRRYLHSIWRTKALFYIKQWSNCSILLINLTNLQQLVSPARRFRFVFLRDR